MCPLKTALRRQAFERRDSLSRRERDAAAEAVAKRGVELARKTLPRGATVAAYWAIRSEIGTQILMEALIAAGFRTALPVTRQTRTPLLFRLWNVGDDLGRGVLGNPEPLAEAVAVTPALVFAPLAAFDARGGRIGYGSGHYDTTLQSLRLHGPVRYVGLAFDVQEVERVPLEPHDIRLDMVLTETRIVEGGTG